MCLITLNKKYELQAGASGVLSQVVNMPLTTRYFTSKQIYSTLPGGILHGRRVVLDSNGNIKKVHMYMKGKKHGTCYNYTNCRLHKVKNYYHGVKHGEVVVYKNDEPIQIDTYSHGKLCNSKYLRVKDLIKSFFRLNNRF